MDALNTIDPPPGPNPHRASGEVTHEHSKDNSPVEGLTQNSYDETMVVEEKAGNRRHRNKEQAKKKKKRLTAAVMEHLGEVIGQVALKDSKFNRGGEIGESERNRY